MDENLLDDAEVIISDEEENTQESSESGDEVATDLAEELEKARKANSQILARAKKAEEEVKKFKSLNLTPKAQPQINNSLSREEAILIAEGMKVEDLEQLQVIAKGKGLSLLDAKTDPLFVGYYEKVAKERKSEQAKLGVSKGSGSVSNKPNFGQVGLSEEEHKKLWKESLNQ